MRRRVTGEQDHPRCKGCGTSLSRDEDYCSECRDNLNAAATDLYEALRKCAAVLAGETTKGALVAALEAARAALQKAKVTP